MFLKSKLSWVLILCVLMFSFFVTACADSSGDESSSEHKHQYSEWTQTKAATCTEKGEEQRVCENDSTHIETREIDALGHAWGEWTQTKAATCTEKGEEQRVCENDSTHIETRDVDALGHAWSEWTQTKAATCTEKGEEQRVCENDSTHIETREIDAIPHAIEHHARVEATITTEGSIEYWKCTACGCIFSDANCTNRITLADTVLQKRKAILTVSANEKTFGSVTGSQSAFNGQSVTVTAKANEGFKFLGWYNGNALVSNLASYTFAMPANDYTLVAMFEAGDIWDGSIATSFAGGTGTENDPYLISNGAQLAFLAQEMNSSDDNQYNNKYYRLKNDIDLNGREWDPIGYFRIDGSNYSSSRAFKGSFDGDNHVVFNFKITAPDETNNCAFGLFGAVYSGGIIKNLSVENYTASFSTSFHASVGVVVGRLGTDSKITNCNSTGSIDVKSNDDGLNVFAGGIAAYAEYSVIADCHSAVQISETSNTEYSCAGGIAGFSSGEIKNCNATGSVSATSNSAVAYAGGITGYTSEPITNCFATGSVSAVSKSETSGAYAGGVAGRSNAVLNCYSTGSVSATAENDENYAYAGGITGLLYRSEVTNSYATGAISAKNNYAAYAGGIAGRIYQSTITNCYATGNIAATSSAGTAYSGGISGNMAENCTIANCYRYDGQTVAATQGTSDGDINLSGATCTLAQLNAAGFYTTTLGWDTENDWDILVLDFVNRKMPVLKH